jgi:hypothetical protein
LTPLRRAAAPRVGFGLVSDLTRGLRPSQ